MSKKELMLKFIEFVTDFLNIETNLKITLTNNRDDITTTAYYNINSKFTKIYIKNRAIVDVMRSLAHEMVHHMQNERGDLGLNADEGNDGSPLENEANSKAGEIIRIFGKQNPEIYINDQ